MVRPGSYKVEPQEIATIVKKARLNAASIEQRLIAQSIKPRTTLSYEGQLRWLKLVLRELGETTLTKSALMTILHVIQDRYEGHKAERLRDAAL